MFLAFFFPEKKKKTPKDQLMGKLVEIKRRRVEIKKRKALASFGTNCLSIRNEEKIIKLKQMMNDEYLSLFKASLQLALLSD